MKNPLKDIYAKKLTALKDQVEYTLETYPKTRDSDKLLTWDIWITFYDATMYINKDQFMNLPSEDNIKRIRAHIQNTLKRYLPMTWAVAEARGWSEKAWRELLGYQPGLFDDRELTGTGGRK